MKLSLSTMSFFASFILKNNVDISLIIRKVLACLRKCDVEYALTGMIPGIIFYGVPIASTTDMDILIFFEKDHGEEKMRKLFSCLESCGFKKEGLFKFSDEETGFGVDLMLIYEDSPQLIKDAFKHRKLVSLEGTNTYVVDRKYFTLLKLLRGKHKDYYHLSEWVKSGRISLREIEEWAREYNLILAIEELRKWIED